MSYDGSDEPGLGRKLASAGAEVAGELAKEVTTQAAGAVFSAGYFIVMALGSVVIMIGALTVVLIGGAVSALLLLPNVPALGGLIAPFWGIVLLVLLFVGIRWLVRRVGRPIERSVEHAVENIHKGIDVRTAGVRLSAAAPAPDVTATPEPARTSRPTLAELDARLAPPEQRA